MPSNRKRTGKRVGRRIVNDLAKQLKCKVREVREAYSALPDKRKESLISRYIDMFGLEVPGCGSVYEHLKKSVNELVNYISRERAADKRRDAASAYIEPIEPIITKKQIEKRVLTALRIATGTKASLDAKLSQIITEDLTDAEFLMRLQEQFNELSKQDLEEIQKLYPVRCGDVREGGLGLNLGRRTEKDCTVKEVADYILQKYQSPARYSRMD